MGSTAGHLTRFGHGFGKTAVVAGAAAAMLGTAPATAATMTPAHAPAAGIGRPNLAARHSADKPRTGSGRDPVWLGPGRTAVAGRLIPAQPSASQIILN
jgi:hypothetical protein